MTFVTRSVVLFGLAALSGCASESLSPAGTAGQVKRIIQCVEKPGVDPESVLNLANDLAKTPGVLDVAAGRGQLSDLRMPATLPAETITFFVTFENEAARSRALNDRTYRHVVDDLIGRACSSVQSQDVTLQNYLVSQQYTEETTAAVRERRAAAIKQQTELQRQTR